MANTPNYNLNKIPKGTKEWEIPYYSNLDIIDTELKKIDDKIQTNNDKVGDLTTLQTTNKTNTVNAINEIKNNIDSLNDIGINDNVPSDTSVYSSNKVDSLLLNKVDKNNMTPVGDSSILYKQGSQSKDYGFVIPNMSLSVTPVIEVDSSKLTDGAKFVSVINVEGVLSNPLDKFYAYVAAHDGQDIYLFTAPTPEGVWTFRQSVKNVSNSPFTDHISSPCAIVVGKQIYLYYHGWYTTNGTQPTALATSTDGINFTNHAKFPVISTHPNKSSKFYGHSTSYAHVIKYNGIFMAVFQANNDLVNAQTANATVAVGCAISSDGINFRVMKKPLRGNIPLNRGCFGPEVIKLFDKWLLMYTDMADGQIKGAVSDNLEFDSFTDIGVIIQRNTATWNAIKVEAQSALFYNNKLYLYYAGWDATNFGRIGLATIDLGVM